MTLVGDTALIAQWEAELDAAIREAAAAAPFLQPLSTILMEERDAILQAAAAWHSMEAERRGRLRMFYPVD